MRRQKLRDARKAKGFTQEQVAKAAGIDRTAYTRIENGKREPPVDVALNIAQTLGTKVEEIFLPAVVHGMHNKGQY